MAYRRQYRATNIESIHKFREAFPVVTYEQDEPLINQAMACTVAILLAEEIFGWPGLVKNDQIQSEKCLLV